MKNIIYLLLICLPIFSYVSLHANSDSSAGDGNRNLGPNALKIAEPACGTTPETCKESNVSDIRHSVCNATTGKWETDDGKFWVAWKCSLGDVSINCAAQAAPPQSCAPEPKCGSANGGTFTSKPTSGLCSVGDPAGDPSESTSGWSWFCIVPGKRSGDCSATKKVETITPTCSGDATSPGCVNGTVQQVHDEGEMKVWACVSSDGKVNAPCSAKKVTTTTQPNNQSNTTQGTNSQNNNSTTTPNQSTNATNQTTSGKGGVVQEIHDPTKTVNTGGAGREADNGYCGFGDQNTYDNESLIDDNSKCNPGLIKDFKTTEKGWSWRCVGNKTSSSCSATRVADINPECGDGVNEYCKVGTANTSWYDTPCVDGEWRGSPTGEFGKMWSCIGPNAFRGKTASCFLKQPQTSTCSGGGGGGRNQPSNGSSSSTVTGNTPSTNNLDPKRLDVMQASLGDPGLNIKINTVEYTCNGGKGYIEINKNQEVDRIYIGINNKGFIKKIGNQSNFYVRGCGCPGAIGEQVLYSGGGTDANKIQYNVEFKPDGNGIPEGCNGSSTSQNTSGNQGSSSSRTPLTADQMKSPTGNIRGILQKAECDADGYITVRGWSCDTSATSKTTAVHFYADDLVSGNLIGHVIADVDMKQQAISDQCGGSSNHRFNDKKMLQPVTNIVGPVAEKWRDGKEHKLTAFGISANTTSNAILGYLDDNSPYFTCPVPGSPVSPGGSTSQTPVEPCGSIKGTMIYSAPTTNLCGAGISLSKPVSYQTKCTAGATGMNGVCAHWEWECGGTSCVAWDGSVSSCGPSDGQIVSTKPTTNLCASGVTASAVSYEGTCTSPGGPNGTCAHWMWQCGNTSCSAWDGSQKSSGVNTENVSSSPKDTSTQGDIPKVAISISGNILSGTVTGLSGSSVSYCYEITERGSGINSKNYCTIGSDTSHWKPLVSSESGWTYVGGTWKLSTSIGDNTAFPEGNYRMYWKENGGKSIDTKFQILLARGVRILGLAEGNGDYWKDGSTFLSSEGKLAGLRNTLVKNITTLTTNVDPEKIVGGVVYYKKSIRLSQVEAGYKTLIVYGNLTIDQDITSTRGIIVLKNGEVGGDIIVEGEVKSLKGVFYADGVFRGPSEEYTEKNDDEQLVLNGVLYSHNTLGGSAFPEDLFIYPRVTTSDRNKAFMQDLNNVRSGNGGKTYKGKYIDAFIIDYDASILTNPPPGF